MAEQLWIIVGLDNAVGGLGTFGIWPLSLAKSVGGT